MSDIISDNINARNVSFLYFLHEENKFDKKSFMELCDCICRLDSITVIELRNLHFIENQILRHIVYHFDKNDMCEICNLPQNYGDYIELLDDAINGLRNVII